MKDQYNNPIPADLTLLDVPIMELTDLEIEALAKLDWYCLEGNKDNCIFVSCAALENALDGLLDEYSPEDIYSKPYKIVNIADVLKRWNRTDGFYHA